MKAISTKYKGYNFRSRLEARWAVYFDAAGIGYKYEDEGYELRNGVFYLPDFTLLEMGSSDIGYAEVKPAVMTDDELLKCALLAKESGRIVALLEGMPDHRFWRTAEGINADGTVKIGKCVLFGPKIASMLQANIDAAKSARFEFGESGAT